MKVKYIGQRDTIAFNRKKAYEVMSIEKGWFRIFCDYIFANIRMYKNDHIKMYN